MARSVFYDGLNLALATGTGVATYTRGLIKTSRRLGYQSAVIHSQPVVCRVIRCCERSCCSMKMLDS